MSRKSAGTPRFTGFPAELFVFLRSLEQNNNRDWFAEHRAEYDASVLTPLKGLMRNLGPFIRLLNSKFAVEPRAGVNISRINTGARATQLPYHTHLHAWFGPVGSKWKSTALIYLGVHPAGVTVGFHPGLYPGESSPLQEQIKSNTRLFRQYLSDYRISERYSELSDSPGGSFKGWPLPATPRRWTLLESFAVGHAFAADEPILADPLFSDRVREIFLDLYPLWLFSSSPDPRQDVLKYAERARLLSRPVTRAAD